MPRRINGANLLRIVDGANLPRPRAYTSAAGISPHLRRNRTQSHAHMRLPLPASCSLRICDLGAAYAQAQMRLRRTLLCSAVLGRSANLLDNANEWLTVTCIFRICDA